MMLRRIERYPIENWGGRISGHPAFLLGNGPSLQENDLSLLDGFFTIGINRAYKAIDPTMLLWQDKSLFKDGLEGLLSCSAIKVCRDKCNIDNRFTSFRLRGPKYAMPTNPSELYGFGCSGVLAAELAVSMGATSIVLLGMDCDYAADGRTDFYGKNDSHNAFTVANFHGAMSWLKKSCRVPVYNCGNATYWPRQSLRDVIDLLKPMRYSRLQWLTKLRIESVSL